MIDFLSPKSIISHCAANSKRDVLQEMARVAARQTGIHERIILDAIVERERLGSTGVGRGVAVPHARLLDLSRVTSVFCRLDTPIAFDAADEKPVDLLFMILSPHDAGADHLKALARVSRVMRDPVACDRLRAAVHSDALYTLLCQSDVALAA